MTLPSKDDPRLRDACAERCAESGDPPCYALDGTGPINRPFIWKPCGECYRDCGFEPGDEFDADAAVGLLL